MSDPITEDEYLRHEVERLERDVVSLNHEVGRLRDAKDELEQRVERNTRMHQESEVLMADEIERLRAALGACQQHHMPMIERAGERIAELEADRDAAYRQRDKHAVENERYRNTIAQAAAWLDGPERSWVLSNAGIAEPEAAALLEGEDG